VSGRFSQARISAVEIVRGPDHIAIRTAAGGEGATGSEGAAGAEDAPRGAA
jgi:hypothetical protein